ncbi:MAG: hypothetical protein IM574_13755 [Cytophagales bacterium]|jgi:hypothetical protein|nr:hypothetical protein [Cytophagales bacterium]MCA6388133.1 hypothetical protein [Cytophagales bacterium]MCA6391902.1 hypothetical protein [Cytophagales bacterium]MCA6395382.1 hypothetical protein [Cytophagales bacterium]MCA6400006.1 hypothetical protein [Cytophagales bacterium]
MPIRQTLLNEISAEIGSLSGANINSASSVDNIYEVYLLSLILRAVRNEGGTYSFTNITPAGTLCFRASPGYITSTAQNYTFVEVIFPDKPELEAMLVFDQRDTHTSFMSATSVF